MFRKKVSVVSSAQNQSLPRLLCLLLITSLTLVGRGASEAQTNIQQSAGAWFGAGAMTVARSGHTATLLSDRRVLVAGGRGAANQDLNSAEIYDPATDRWMTTGNLNEARASHSAVLL